MSNLSFVTLLRHDGARRRNRLQIMIEVQWLREVSIRTESKRLVAIRLQCRSAENYETYRLQIRLTLRISEYIEPAASGEVDIEKNQVRGGNPCKWCLFIEESHRIVRIADAVDHWSALKDPKCGDQQISCRIIILDVKDHAVVYVFHTCLRVGSGGPRARVLS